MIQLGAQMYTVRSLLNTPEEAEQTMEKIKAIGYDSVQLYGGEERMRICGEAAKKVGLSVSGTLVNRKVCEAMGNVLFDLCREYGMKDIGISAFHTDAAGARDLIAWANAYGKQVRQEGFTFSYHNHDKEFIRTEEDKTVMQLYLDGFDPEAVDFMPDTYWLQCGGSDVRHFLESTRGRVTMLHLKDMAYTKEGPKFAEVGRGNLWFPGILKMALDCGIENFAVEQDTCDGDPIESLRISYNYIRQLGFI